MTDIPEHIASKKSWSAAFKLSEARKEERDAVRIQMEAYHAAFVGEWRKRLPPLSAEEGK